MLWKNGNKRLRLCVMFVTGSLFLAGLWAVLATPDTALADKPDNPGRNVVQQDIPAILTLDGGSLASDDGSYSNLENGISCWVGRRRSIWVTLSKNSPRSMNLDLGSKLVADSGDPTPGCDPWGDPVMDPGDVVLLDLPDGLISQVDLQIAPYLNVSGLGDEYLGENFPYCDDIDTDGFADNTMHASTWLIFLDDAGEQWGIYFGPGRMTEVEWGEWGGGRIFTRPDAPPVKIQRINPDEEDPKIWKADSQSTPGFLWYRGSNKNAPYVFVGKYSVPWSCTVESLP